ncbi:MAG: Lsr2 family protein [Bifidobacteriaceae bacterium]|jgi:hypothetical protein|nr:Lsr2 family protein [Bifidobacteriaceae bacterium]
MAQRVVVEFLDDLDRSPAATTVEFSLDGIAHTIDLNEAHAAELRGFLETYVNAGRRAGGKTAGFDPAAVRAWADSNGVKVSKRGRIPAAVIDRYHAAGY